MNIARLARRMTERLTEKWRQKQNAQRKDKAALRSYLPEGLGHGDEPRWSAAHWARRKARRHVRLMRKRACR